ncbi:ABC transporter ATP-binding protein [bacterium]|nr:ABC transporter ATP-binding protein [bacterium]
MKIFIRLSKSLLPYWVPLLLGIIAMLLFTISNVALVYMVSPVLKTLFRPDSGTIESVRAEREAQLREGDFIEGWRTRMQSKLDPFVYKDTRIETLANFCILLIIIMICKNFFLYWQTILTSVALQGIMNDYRKKLFEHIHNLSLAFFDRQRTGDIISRIVSDVQTMQDSISVAVADLIRDPLSLLIYYLILLFLDWKLTLIITAMIPVIALILNAIGKHLRRYTTRGQERMADSVSVLQETISGIRVVKAFDMAAFELRRFAKFADDYLRNILKMIRVRRLAGPFNEIIATAIAVCVLWFTGRKVIAGSGLPAESFMQYVIVLFLIMQPIKTFSNKFARINTGLAAAKRVFELMDTPPIIVENPDAKDVKNLSDAIVFQNVSFQYEGTDKPALANIDLSIPKGKIIALVGPSGAGKSTLADLIPRFYDPTEGRILLDGTDLRDIKISSLRRLMGIVTQEVILFNDTIRANIAYGHSEWPEERIIEAAKTANAWGFIQKLPDNLDTMIGDRGTKLSGGERQRLAIARAILKNPEILIFDEATSSLDTESERLVQEAIDRLMVGRTAIVIAHRLSTIVHAHKIVVLSEGNIIESGTHEELLRQNGLYKSLYEHQFNIS